MQLKGVQDREIEIAVDVRKMESLQIGFNDIENAIGSENLTLSGGEIVNNNVRGPSASSESLPTLRSCQIPSLKMRVSGWST